MKFKVKKRNSNSLIVPLRRTLRLGMTSDVRSAFNALQPWLDRPENEDSWQQIDTALKKFHALVRSGLTDQPAELVAHIRRKETVFGLVRSVRSIPQHFLC